MEIPSDSVEHIEFDSDQSLLDADIVLYKPTLGDYDHQGLYKGKPWLTESASFQVSEQVAHWRRELLTVFDAGKLVLIFLATPTEVYVETGEKEFSGTGRNRHVTHLLKPLSSYDAIPVKQCVTARSGSKIAPVKDLQYLASYWSDFALLSPYEVTIEGKFSETLLVTTSGNHTVGAILQKAGSGHILLLPPIRFNEDKFIRFNEEKEECYWTEIGIEHGHRFVSTVIEMSSVLQVGTELSPVPEWAGRSLYRLDAEAEIENQILKVREQIDQLNEQKSILEDKLQKAGILRYLLYERGKPLEAAIIEALSLFGFSAKQYEDADSEFDAVFECPEGRCLGEAEGKDNRPINIDKLRQLDNNIQEDFAKGIKESFAKGVLFGNAFRLTPIADRKPAFTEKCVKSALRTKVALVHTPDMFEPARFLKTSRDATYANRSRRAIFEAEGVEVKFPDVPEPRPTK